MALAVPALKRSQSDSQMSATQLTNIISPIMLHFQSFFFYPKGSKSFNSAISDVRLYFPDGVFARVKETIYKQYVCSYHKPTYMYVHIIYT